MSQPGVEPRSRKKLAMLNLVNCPGLVSKCQSVKAIPAATWPGQNRKAIFATQMPLISDANAKGQILLVLRGREKEGSRHSLTSGNNLRRHLNSHRFHRLIFVHCSHCSLCDLDPVSTQFRPFLSGSTSKEVMSLLYPRMVQAASLANGLIVLTASSNMSNDKHPD